jgi:hypothetical protein
MNVVRIMSGPKRKEITKGRGRSHNEFHTAETRKKVTSYFSNVKIRKNKMFFHKIE